MRANDENSLRSKFQSDIFSRSGDMLNKSFSNVLSTARYSCHSQLLTRSILDYGSPIYGLESHSSLALLDPVQNASIHIATGAFRTSPSLSLCADAGIPGFITVSLHSLQSSSPQ